jgi:hypothetical protein
MSKIIFQLNQCNIFPRGPSYKQCLPRLLFLITLITVNFSPQRAFSYPVFIASFTSIRLKRGKSFRQEIYVRKDRVSAIDTVKKLKLKVGGEVRTRYEKYWNDNWGGAPRDYNGYVLHRFLLFADLNLSNKVRFYTELKSALHSNLDIPPRPVDQDKLDFQQLFLTFILNRPSSNNLTSLKIGRQELSLGSNRLVDKRDYTNALLSFDGFDFLVKQGNWQINAFAFRQSRMSFGVFDNMPDPDRNLWGIYLSRFLKSDQSGGLDLYYIGQNRNKISYTFGDYISFDNEGPYAETRHTFGVRFYNHLNGFDYDIEPMSQVGTYSKNNQNIRAWRVAATVGYTFDQMTIKPRLYLNVDMASGDGDSTDRTLNTFHSPYTDILDPSTSNITGFKVGLNTVLKNKISVNIFEWLFWRTSTEDGIYGFLGFPYRAPGQNYGKYIGNSPAIIIAWPINNHISLTGLYATEFVGGGFLSKEPPGENLSYAGLSVTYKSLKSSK